MSNNIMALYEISKKMLIQRKPGENTIDLFQGEKKNSVIDLTSLGK